MDPLLDPEEEKEKLRKLAAAADSAMKIRILSSRPLDSNAAANPAQSTSSSTEFSQPSPARPAALAKSSLKPSFIPSTLLVRNRPEPESEEIRSIKPIGIPKVIETAPKVDSDSEFDEGNSENEDD